MAVNGSNSEWQISCDSICDANLHLLETGVFSDVVFVVGSEKSEIPAHKLLLMTRSPVFEAMFARWDTGQNTKVEIPEVERCSFMKFLDFIYTDNVVSISGKVTAEVLYLAHKYNVPKLAKECSNILSQSIVVTNAIALYQIASKLQQEALLKQTEEFILKNGKAVFLDSGFLEIEKDNLCAFLKNDNLRVDEVTVFRAVMKWADNHCTLMKKGSTVKNQRAVLKDVLPLIRFPTMSATDFTDEVVRRYEGLLTDREVLSLYKNFTTALPSSITPNCLPFNTLKRAGNILFRVNLFTPTIKSAQSKIHKPRFDRTICRNYEIGYYNTYNSTIEGVCETTISICPDKDIRIQSIVLSTPDDTLFVGKSAEERCKPLIRSFTEILEKTEEQQLRQTGIGLRVVNSENVHLKTSISIATSNSSTVSGGGHSPVQELKRIEDIAEIKFEKEINVNKNTTCDIKLTVTGSSMPSLNCKNMSPIQLKQSTSEKVNCESVVVSFRISPPATKCLMHTYSADCFCISTGHIRAINFTI